MADDPSLYLPLSVKETDILDGEPVRAIGDASHGEPVQASGAPSGASHVGEVQFLVAADSADGNRAAEPAVFTSIPLPWGSRKERASLDGVDVEVNSGEYVMRALFAEFTAQSKRKAEAVMLEPLERPLSKSLQRGEDPQFDQLLTVFGSVAEFCLPSLLRVLFAWYDRQGLDVSSTDPHASVRSDKSRQDPPPDRQEWENREDRRDLAIEFVFCLVLVEVLRQLHLHPGHEDLVRHLENMAFRHFKYRESSTAGPNAANVNLISDLYAEVIGVLAQSRFQPVRTRFMRELRELSAKESCQQTSQGIIALLMGMKFFRVKMVPIEEFEASFQFLQELSQYFLEVKDKDIKHALAGLFVEILVPVAACVKNEVNVPCLKSLVEMLYTHTLDMCTKGKHRLAIFPLVTCLLCVSQKQFFLSNWHYFLAMCLSNLKNKDTKMSRVALESLYRLLWVYMIRIKCESNSATQSRLQSIVNSLFPKGSKNVVPRETPLNIFVKIIQFIAQERLDFAMRDIVFDLLSVGRPIKIVTTPERMSIGLRAFLVVADSLQQKEGQPPMPRTMAVLPSGSTLRVKKTFLSTVLSDDTARGIGVAAYYLHVRRVFGDILRALDAQLGAPLLMTSTQNVNKEPDELITGERKPKIDLFRTCVAAIPRLLPDGMDRQQLVELLTRLTVHLDEELRVLSFQSLQNLVLNLAEWRHDVLVALVSFVSRHVADTCHQQLLDNALRMLLQLMSAWRNAGPAAGASGRQRDPVTVASSLHPDPASVLHLVEGFVLVTLCHYRLSTRRLCVHILKEAKLLFRSLNCLAESQCAAIDVLDSACALAVDRCHSVLPPGEKAALLGAGSVDLQWIAERNSAVWTAGVYDDGARSTSLPYLGGADAWRVCLTVFLERQHLPSRCTGSMAHAWPIVHQRTQALLALVEPPPASENRASLLRPATASKRPTDQRDSRLSLWRNYALFAYRVMPSAVISPAFRCISPDSAPASLSTVPLDTSSTTTGGSLLSVSGVLSGNTGSEPVRAGDPVSLHRLMVPLLRCDTCHELRDGVTEAFGLINHAALSDLLLELVAYIREAIDRKQENVRRRRRRDALRLQLITVFETIAEQGVFGLCPSMIDTDSQSLYPMFVDYIDGARLYLETESDKDATATVQAIKLKFCWFVRKLIHNFSLEARATLLSGELRRSLCQLLASWSGPLGAPFRGASAGHPRELAAGWAEQLSDLELAAVHACWSLICCGSLFDPTALQEEGSVFTGLDLLLSAAPPRLQLLARESLVLLLEFNTEASVLLDWVVERCHTGGVMVADSCFHAIATVFGARDYPCDHYTAIINVTLLNTGCPRADVHETAFQLLLVLEQRFFGHGLHVLPGDGEWEGGGRQTSALSLLDSRLAAGFCRSQLFLSQQLAQLHPELTMPLFSEITCRLQTARPDARQLMLQYLLPWLHNMELVDPHVPAPGAYSPNRADSWGSAEATEMVVNNLLYVTAELGDHHSHALEQLWSTLCSCWPNNLKIILRYLFIVCGMSSGDLLRYGRRVVVYLARARPEQLVQEMIRELRTVESTSYSVERTETPPFYRLTALRKASSHSVCRDETLSMATEKGTIHTKRHSGDQNPVEFTVGLSSSASSSGRSRRCLKERSTVTAAALGVERSASATAVVDNFTLLRVQSEGRSSMSPPALKVDTPQPRPLPMPEYGGYFAPLYRYLPTCSQPLGSYHRCNLALMLLQDVLMDGGQSSTPLWPIHSPLLLHIAFLALDHSRSVVVEAGRRVLLALLVVLGRHPGHTSVARALFTCRIELLQYGIVVTPVLAQRLSVDAVSEYSSVPATVAAADCHGTSIEQRCLSLIDFLASRRQQCLWSHEDVTARDWQLVSAQQLANLLQLVVDVFAESLSRSRVRERWAQLALHVALSCSSRHLAGRSLQIFRALRVPINSRMFSDVLSRLVETVGEQGEDMQGYVTEIMLTLGAAVDCIDSEFRPIDFGKELFNSTPNLIGREQGRKMLVTGSVGPTCGSHLAGHLRASCMTASSRRREEEREVCVSTDTQEEADSTTPSPGSLSRSHSASNLKGVQVVVEADAEKCKLTVLSQLFWLAVSMLESDFEHEYLLAMRLLDKLLAKLSLERRECREKLEKIQQQLRWPTFPGLHALLLKGCTHAVTYDLAIDLISRLTPFLQISVVDPSLSLGFPMNVVALLPHMVHHYEDANEFCLHSAENIALACMERDSKLENLATVMTLYSRRTFSRESMQWTKCVVKYLTDAYSQISVNLMVFLVDVLEKGPAFLQLPILNVLGCLLHYMEPCASNTSLVNADLLQAMSRCVQQVGPHWREALCILKLAVTQSSALALAPSVGAANDSRLHVSFSNDATLEPLLSIKKELPGRTMEFTFDVSQVPIIGRRLPDAAVPGIDADSASSSAGSAANGGNSDGDSEEDSGCATLRRSTAAPAAAADASSQQSCWRRPWQSQARTRDRLVHLLMSCGTRVGLPKSPSVIFSQNSDLMERRSSVASSTEEMSVGGAGATVNASAESLDDHEAQQFSVIRVFDFLEYELASQDGESLDNFNWGVRRRTLSDTAADTLTVLDTDTSTALSDTRSADHSAACSRVQLEEEPVHGTEESSDDDGGSVSPLDMTVTCHDVSGTAEPPGGADERLTSQRRLSSSSESSIPSSEVACPACSSPTGSRSQSAARALTADDSGRLASTLLELSPGLGSRHSSDLEEQWFRQLAQLTDSQQDTDQCEDTMVASAYLLFCRLLADIQRSFVLTVDECVQLVPPSPPPVAESATAFCHQLVAVADLLRCMQLPLVYINSAAVCALAAGAALKFALLELQEHVLTYQERRELVARCVDAGRCTLLLLDDTTGEGGSAGGPLVDHWCLQLLHSLHRLHFQLLLLFDGLAKTLSVLAARPSELVLDTSAEVNQLRHRLNESSASQPDAVNETSDADGEDVSSISRLLTEGRCAEAVAVFRRVRHQLPTELVCEGDDIDSLLAVYCWLRSQQDQSPLVALSRTTQLDTACSLLQQTNVTLVTQLRHMERVTRCQPSRQRQLLSDTQSVSHSADC